MVDLAEAWVQPNFYYACCSWYSALTHTLKIGHRAVSTGWKGLFPVSLQGLKLTERHGWFKVDVRVSWVELCNGYTVVHHAVPKYLQ